MTPQEVHLYQFYLEYVNNYTSPSTMAEHKFPSMCDTLSGEFAARKLTRRMIDSGERIGRFYKSLTPQIK